MSIEPKLLNMENSGYGSKKMPSDWGVLGLKNREIYFEGINDLYDSGDYSQVIKKGLKRIKNYKSIDDLKKMNEIDLAVFCYLGLSYLKLNDTENAISCFHIVLSQTIFTQSMLSGFSSYIDMARFELDKLAERYGQERVQDNDPGLFLKDKSSRKCIIATTVCGSEHASDVIILKAFRDDVLATHSWGRTFIQCYYVLSPPIARRLERNKFAADLLREFLIRPLAVYIRSKLERDS